MTTGVLAVNENHYAIKWLLFYEWNFAPREIPTVELLGISPPRNSFCVSGILHQADLLVGTW